MNILFFLPLIAALILSACSEMPAGLGGHEAPSAPHQSPPQPVMKSLSVLIRSKNYPFKTIRLQA